jgi:hypothetical protein
MPTEAKRNGLSSEGMLVATACALAALVVVQAVRSGWLGLPEARADSASHVDDHTMLTMDGGNEDIVLILDGHAEQLLVYRVKNQDRLELAERHDVRSMFMRAKGGGRP